MRALLNVNVLIALHDQDHVHHARAASWLTQNALYGWASYPLTQNGCLRIMAQPAYPGAQPLPLLTAMLQRSTASAFHALWSNDISLLDNTRFNHGWIHNHKQLNDVYLLGLAVKNEGRMVTFDQRIALAAVQGAMAEHWMVL
jgi:toxin-antitoxin system PIN domain toxin